MKKFTKSLQAVAVAAALGMAGGAQAGVIAQSVLEVSNFVIRSGSTVGPALNVSALGGLIFSDNTDVTATLNGVTATDNANSNVFGLLDLAQQCVGACGGFAQNDYTHRLVQTVTVARGDTFLAGSPVAGTPAPLGAVARTVAEVQLVPDGTGTTTSNLGLLSTFVFTALANEALAFTLDANMHLVAAISADMGPGSNAQATSTLTFDLFNITTGADVFSWAVGNASIGGSSTSPGCSVNRTISNQTIGTTRVSDCAGAFSGLTPLLVAGQTYEFNIKHVSLVDAKAVPEPETLGLLGIGLLGLVAGLRRRKAKVVA